MSEHFDGRVALITGAGKGLGRAYALWMAARGAAVVVNNRVHPGIPSTAQAVVGEIRQAGGKAIADEHAVEDETGARAMVDAAHERFGRLDIVVCNAGIAVNTPFHELSLEKMREVMDINFWGSFYPLHAALSRMMQAGYGRIVVTTSQAALYGLAGALPYASSKAALIGMARTIACDIGKEANIRINVIAPAANTSMSRRPVSGALAELISPFKVAPVVGWLCSEACNGSGMIFNVGAGRVRRVMIQENAPIEIPGQGMAGCWPALDDMNGAVEARDAVASARVLMPEFFAAVNKDSAK